MDLNEYDYPTPVREFVQKTYGNNYRALRKTTNVYSLSFKGGWPFDPDGASIDIELLGNVKWNPKTGEIRGPPVENVREEVLRRLCLLIEKIKIGEQV